MLISVHLARVEQVLYFDRYTRLLAPDLDVLADDRLTANQPAGGPPGAPQMASAMSEEEPPPVAVEVEVV